ncbi:MAG: hypothetical protein ACO1OB_13595 [Archangium sp.]
MKFLKFSMLVTAAVFSTSAFAGECEKSCDDVVKQCRDMCKTTLKGKDADKVGFCQDKCKEFDGECKKDCQDEKR